jgi:hypothetical protein
VKRRKGRQKEMKEKENTTPLFLHFLLVEKLEKYAIFFP